MSKHIRAAHICQMGIASNAIGGSGGRTIRQSEQLVPSSSARTIWQSEQLVVQVPAIRVNQWFEWAHHSVSLVGHSG